MLDNAVKHNRNACTQTQNKQQQNTNKLLLLQQMHNRNACTHTQNQQTKTNKLLQQMHSLSNVFSYSYTELTDSF